MQDRWPADRVERRKVADLIPYARNARTHSDEQVAQIAASIREWGWTTPVLIDEAGGIIAGHGRVMAARKLALTDVPVVVAAGWSDAQKRAYVLADNKLALNAGWDSAMLANELRGLEGFDLSLIGFNSGELAAVFDVPNFAPGTEDEQGKLDQLAPKIVQCPHCGQEYNLREHGQG
jgi:ParB-like chromosome segregation protein Spo0J